MRKKRFRNSVVEHILSVLIIITAPWHFYNTIEFEQHSLQGLLKTNASLLLSKPLDADSKYQTHSAQPGESLTDALKYFNIALPTIQKYQRKLRSEGFASLSQGDSLVFTQNLFQNVTIVSILNNLNTWYHLYNHADGTITIEKKPVKLTTYRCMVKGSLTSTITHDLSKLGLSDVLVSKLADIFAW
ncbi:MAG: hypothetical protein JW795_00490, partial [Chitinivibrionales bacterium]|nr:hypothetical protein [Chitinivibrionales bacterium]